ncbi:MAG: hypothetical protein SGBAC_003598 [Bacillariaceae sp.]
MTKSSSKHRGSCLLLLLIASLVAHVNALEVEEREYPVEIDEDIEYGDGKVDGDIPEEDYADDQYIHDTGLYIPIHEAGEDEEDGSKAEEDWFIADQDTNHPRCRDDPYINCEEVQESGDCDPEKTGILPTSRRNLCSVTCGICAVEEDAVWLEYKCYEYGEDIHVFFHNHKPTVQDYVGIYPAAYDFSKHPELLFEAPMWLTTCGSLEDGCKAAKGGLLFGDLGPSDEVAWNFFPLSVGDYKAVLARGNETIEVVSESDIFRANPLGRSCNNDCQDLIHTDVECYNSGVDTIQITFENCNPHEENLIAIYKDDEAPGEIEPLLWLGTCGTQECVGEVAYDILLFGPRSPDEAARTSWPLPDGDYKAYILQYAPGANHGIPAAETSFIVRKQCAGTSSS